MAKTSELKVLTFSALSKFKNCRRSYKYRYVDNLVSRFRDVDALNFGNIIHDCLEFWHGSYKWHDIENHLNTIKSDDNSKMIKKAFAMMMVYCATYKKDPEYFETIALEQVFSGPIINPETGKASRTFIMQGKIDGVLKRKSDGSYWLLEHKTASNISGDYIAQLYMKSQIKIYTWYAREVLKIPIKGVIYNVLEKSKLKQKEGETDTEYEERNAERKGKKELKRKIAEPDKDYIERLIDWHGDNSKQFRFYREEILIDDNDLSEIRSEIWDLTQSAREAHNKNIFYQNENFCFNYNRPCEYFKICSTRGSQQMIDLEYMIKEPHSELKTEQKNKINNDELTKSNLGDF